MRHEIELRVQVQRPNDSVPQWYPLDIGSGNTLTLDYVSNLLSDVSKITSSRSFTVKLPRTRRNDTAFDLAVVPQHESQRPYRYLPCRVYVDGIDVAGEACMYLVSSEAATYNAVITFGLMQQYKAWVDKGKTLKELADGGQYIKWDSDAAYGRWTGGLVPVYEPPLWFGSDANVNTYTPANGLGKLMYYGIYTPGFVRDDVNVSYANVHPFVTVRELWERIVSENGLNFRLPQSVALDMEDVAIVLTKISGNDPQGNPYTDNNTATGHPETLRLSNALSFGWNIICTTLGDCFTNGNVTTKSKIHYKGDGRALTLMLNMSVSDSTSFPYNGSNRSASYILNEEGHLEYFDLCIYVYATQQTLRLTPTYTGSGLQWSGNIEVPCYGSPVEGDAVADIWIDNDTRMLTYLEGAFDQYWMLGRSSWDAKFTWQNGYVSVIYYQDTHDYPNPAFRFVKNLPDIKQLDFVKMVCNLYGLFPYQTPSGIDFIEIDKLEENKPDAYDWSGYLLEDDPDAPHHTDWHMTDLARRNRVSYKEDDKDLVIDEAWLPVDDDTLDRDKDLFMIPLAASEGDTINQYSLTPEYDTSDPPQLNGYKVEFTECLHRLMRVVEWYNEEFKTVTRLAFQNLSAAYIITERYASYQAYVKQPRILTERLRVPLADLRALDYSRPVFLSKYGRHFAIIDIKWTVTQDTCEAKLLMLGSQIGDVSPTPPPVLLTGIRASFNQGGTIYDTDDLSTLKQYLTVTAEYSDGTSRELNKDEYTLSGSLVAPSSTITVSFEGETDTFTVQVTQVVMVGIIATFTQGGATIFDTDNLDDLKQYLTVVASYSDGTTAAVSSSDYTLSGSLVAPSSTITVTYEGFTDTFTVQVTHQQVLPYDSLVEYLESDGTQVLDTGIVVAETDFIYCKAMFLTMSGDNFLLGASGASGEGGTWIENYSNNTYYVRFGSTSSLSTHSVGPNVEHAFTLRKGHFYADGGSHMQPAYSSMPSTSVAIFGRKKSDGTFNYGKTRIKEFYIDDASSNKRIHLYPCRKDGVGYMYNAVTNSLMPHIGIFAYGNDI